MKEIYECKLANLVKDNYLIVVSHIFQNIEFIYKLTSMSLVKGRERKEHEIIKAALEY